MCYSATASFGSAALLFSVGTGTALINRSSSHKMFVAIPFLFSIQQAAEGIIWVSFRQNVPTFLPEIAMTFFLFIALAVWPTWIPWSLLKIEQDKRRQRVLRILRGFGIFVSILAIVALTTGTSHFAIVGHSIDYSISNPFNFLTPNLESLIYTTSTIAPFFISTFRLVKTMGFLLVIGLLITLVINQQAVTSVWCFFAALVSFFIAVKIIMRERNLFLYSS